MIAFNAGQKNEVTVRLLLESEPHGREYFDDALNHVRLTDGEFQRLLDEIVTPDVFTAAHTLRNRSSFIRFERTHRPCPSPSLTSSPAPAA